MSFFKKYSALNVAMRLYFPLFEGGKAYDRFKSERRIRD